MLLRLLLQFLPQISSQILAGFLLAIHPEIISEILQIIYTEISPGIASENPSEIPSDIILWFSFHKMLQNKIQ